MNEFITKICEIVRRCPAVSGYFLGNRTAQRQVASGFAVGCPACPALLQPPYVTRARVVVFILMAATALNLLGTYFLTGQAGQIRKAIGFVLVLLSGSAFNSRTLPDTAGQEA